MKTTNEGFLVNTLRRLPRHGVKALAAGAVLIAAALPLAVASSAGAAPTPPTLTGVWSQTSALNDHLASTVTAGTTTSITLAVAASMTAGELIVDSDTNGVLGTVSASTVTSTTVVLAAPAQTSGTIGDAIGEFAPLPGVGEGGAPVAGVPFAFSGAGFIANGSNVSLASGDADLAFSGVTEVSATWGTASLHTPGATTSGPASLTLTDVNGTSNTLAAAFTIDPDPTVTAVLPNTITQGANNPITVITGTNFAAGAVAFFNSTVDGTPLGAGSAGAGYACTAVTATNCTLAASDFAAVNGVTGPATPGTYAITIVNTDGGQGTSAGIYTVTAYGITNVSPSALPLNGGASTVDQFLTVSGAGFEYGANISIAPDAGPPTGLSIVPAGTLVTSATSITLEVAEAVGATTGRWDITVANTQLGGNNATYTLANALGVDEASAVAPTITAATTSAVLNTGGVAATTTITGTGFSQYSTVSFYAPGSSVASTLVTSPYVAGNTGTSLTASAVAASGATAGSYGVSVSGSSHFAGALTVSGPVITSQTALTVGTPVGSVVTLTGTGFANTDVGAFNAGPGGLAGIISYVSATTLNFVVTSSPAAADITAAAVATPNVVVTQTVGANTTVSPAFKLVVSPGPVVNAAVTYATAPINDVGVGATAQVVVFHGTGFGTGVTIGSFVNGSNIADPNVTATVVSVNTTGTAITATIAVAAGDANIADGYTVTNTNGGITKISAISFPVILAPGPTITTVTPATAVASTTASFTIAGTNFEAGAKVVASADGTCGVATVTTATSLTVSCTFGAATATAATLEVVNPDGGQANSAAVIPALTPPPAPAPHATGEAGNGIVGRTVNIAVAGVGFYGQPTVTSTGNSVRAVVSKDNGTLMTVQVTVGKTTGPGEHTLTFTLANGKVFKVNYLIVK